MNHYILVALADVQKDEMALFLSRLHGHGLTVVYDGDAPRLWLVSYSGTPRQLADLLWPDDRDPEEYELPTGLVVEARPGSMNGYTANAFWRLLRTITHASE